MIWHIFKKDARLLWPLVVLATVAHGLSAIVAGFSTGVSELYVASIPLAFVSLLAIVVLVVSVAHQELLPGAQQDWLIRPISRLDLLTAKLLFVVLLVLGPICVCDVAFGLAHQFSLWEALGASLRRSAAHLCFICVPTLIGAALTRTLTGFVVTVVAAGLALVTLLAIASTLGVAPLLSRSGVSWITMCNWAALSVLAALTILPVQYLKRRTVQARWWSGGLLVCAVACTMLPWRVGFAIQQRLSSQPGAGSSVSLQYDPATPARLMRRAGPPGANGALILFELSVNGLPRNSILLEDHYVVRILDAAGKTLYEGSSPATGAPAPEAGLLLREGDEESGPVLAEQALAISPHDAMHTTGQLVRAEIDYSLTLFRFVAEDWMADVANDQRLAGFARCTTRLEKSGEVVAMSCLSTHPWSACITEFHVDKDTGQKRWPSSDCYPVDYAPFAGGLWGDAYFRIGWFGLGQRLSISGRRPGDGSRAANLVGTYLPRDHFTRHIVIPQFRLP